MVPFDAVAVIPGFNDTPTSAAREDDGSERHVLIPLFLASTFLFLVAYLLFGVVAAVGVLVLFLALAVVASHCCVRRVSRNFPFLHMSLGPADAAGGGTDAAALPAAFGYKREDHAGATGWAQCAICLGLLRVGEAVRRLPACGHLFHAGCIDKWLHAHATCPMCRAPVVSAAVPELPA